MTFNVGFLLFPNITQLDMTGPYEVFTKLPDAKVHLGATSVSSWLLLRTTRNGRSALIACAVRSSARAFQLASCARRNGASYSFRARRLRM
jgi:putative intracellular protease/amidase